MNTQKPLDLKSLIYICILSTVTILSFSVPKQTTAATSYTTQISPSQLTTLTYNITKNIAPRNLTTSEKALYQQLYTLANNQKTYDVLTKLNYKNITVVSLKEFENVDLLRVKPSRTAGEYCWTCTSSTISYCLDKFGLDNCTYVDADLRFYSNPKILIEEINKFKIKSYHQAMLSSPNGYFLQLVNYRMIPF